MSAFQEGGVLSGDPGGFCHPSHGSCSLGHGVSNTPGCPWPFQLCSWHSPSCHLWWGLRVTCPTPQKQHLCPFPSFPPHPAAPFQQLVEGCSMCRFEHLPRAGDSPTCPFPHSMSMETLPGIPSPSFSALTLPAQTQHWLSPLALGWGNGPISGHPPTPDRPCRASRCSGCKSQDCVPLGWEELMAKGWELMRPRGGEEDSSQLWC